MKAALILLLCGFSSALGFNCDDVYPKECRTEKTIRFDFQVTFPETGDDLDDFCKAIREEFECNVAFSKACPESKIATISGALRESTDGFMSFMGKVCDKENPLRQKYLENAGCLNKESESVDNHCQNTVTENGLCKRATEVVKCTEDELVNRCGADGRTLVTELFKQRYAINVLICSLE